MAATLVLKVESEGVFESDLRSVWIFELGQKLTEIATFYIIPLSRQTNDNFGDFFFIFL